jgi:hypothetical protein
MGRRGGALSAAMHSAARVRVIVLRETPLDPIQPPIRHALLEGTQSARELYVSLAGTEGEAVRRLRKRL